MIGAVAEWTGFSSRTSSISACLVRDRWARWTGMPDRQERISRASEMFHTVPNEVLRLAEKRRQRRLSWRGFILVVFPLISTVSDVIATVDCNHDLLPTIVGRTAPLAIGPLLFLLVLQKTLAGPC